MGIYDLFYDVYLLMQGAYTYLLQLGFSIYTFSFSTSAVLMDTAKKIIKSNCAQYSL